MGHKLIRDCRIKWSSMVSSVKSVLDIKEVLENFLHFTTLKFSAEEWELLEEIYGALMPIKDVLDVICRRDADLLEAEIAITELFKTLEALGSPLSQKLLKSLKSEVEKRWNTELVGLLKYLNDPSELLALEEAEKLAKVGRGRKRQKASKGKLHTLHFYYIPYIVRYIAKDDFFYLLSL